MAKLPTWLFSMRTKLLALAWGLALVPLAAAGAFLVDVNRDTVAVANRELQVAIAEDVARSLQSLLADSQRLLAGVAGAFGRSDVADETRIPMASAWIETHGVPAVGIYGATGELIDVLRTSDAPQAFPERLDPALVARASQDDFILGAAQSGETTLIPALSPIRADGEITGYVMALLSLIPLQERVERLAAGHYPGLPEPLFVVDERLRVLVSAGPSPNPANHPMLAGRDPRVLGADFSESGEYRSASGMRMVGTVAGLPETPWAVIVQVPQDVAYASIATMRKAVLVTLALMALIGATLATVFANRITAPLSALMQLAKDLSARRFDRRVNIRTRDELSLLGDTMNRAAADLKESEERIRKEVAIRTDLGRYLPAPLVDQVVLRKHDMKLGGVRREITVLFADVVAFTPLTARLSPEVVVSILNELFTILTEIVFRHEGTVDKFVGDCVMAIWGAPQATEDHAARAVAAAEDMHRWLEIGNATWRERHDVTIQLAIGINSGEAIVGNIGSETRMEYTAIGDAVNVAARLEAVARPQQILVSDRTRRLVGEAAEFRELGPRQLVGHAMPIVVHEVVS